MENSDESAAIVARLTEEDPNLGQFLGDHFKTEEYAMQVVKSSVVANVLNELNNSINLLNNELHLQISTRHEDLLAQTTGIESLESVLDVMTSRISSLKDLISRISIRITEPFEKLESRTLQLARLQDATDLLRRLIRLFYLTKRLRSQMATGTKEITKAAQTLNELNFLEHDGDDLSGIDLIVEDLAFIQKSRKDLDKDAHRLLEKGMHSENPSHVATALQVFYNLGCLGEAVNRIFDECTINAEKSIQEAVDIRLLTDTSTSTQRGPGKANLNIGNQVNLKANLWAALDEMVDHLHLSVINVQQLQRVLVKKRDPLSHMLFADALAKDGNERNLSLKFWRNLVSHIQRQLKKAAQYNHVIKSAFEQEYPKLLRVILNLWEKVRQNKEGFNLMFYGTASADANNSITEADMSLIKADIVKSDYDPEEDLRAAISSFRMAYVSTSLNNLLSSTNSAFQASLGNGKSPIPSSADIEGIYKVLNLELNAVMFDVKLQELIVKNIEKSILLYIAKIEGLVNRTGQTAQVIAGPNEQQQQNIALVNATFSICQMLSAILFDQREYFSESGKQMIISTVDSCEQLMETILEPAFSAVVDAIEAIILTMHKEDFSIAEHYGKKPSLYMREMESFIRRVVQEHFHALHAKDFLAKHLAPLASRAINLFVRHALLVRPLGAGGKMRLIQDFGHIEQSLSPLCSRLSDLGDSYRLLRAFRPLIHATDEDMLQNPSLGVTVPYSFCIHMLISRADPQLRSPFQVADWSHSKYSQWLDEHQSEKERLSLLKGTIDNYTKQVAASKESQFVSQLPTITKLLQLGLQS